jgi:hypothetical protein
MHGTHADKEAFGSGKMSNTRIHWARILLGGLLAEVALILAIVPLGLRFGNNFLHYTAPPGSFVKCFLGALWVCRRIESHFILIHCLTSSGSRFTRIHLSPSKLLCTHCPPGSECKP